MKKPISLSQVTFIAILVVVGAFFLWPVVAGDRPLYAACAANVKQLTMGMLAYAADNDGNLPLADNWLDASVATYSKNYKLNPYCRFIKNRKPDQIGYAMYFKMAGCKTDSFSKPEATILVFESVVLDKNAATGLVGFGDRHKSVPFGFADGHIKHFGPSDKAEREKIIAANIAIK